MGHDERGQVTAFVIIFMVALVAVAGLVIDGGLALSAQRRAMNEAQGAARAGAEALDVGVYRASGVSKLDEGAAKQSIQNYMGKAHSGIGYDVEFPSDDSVAVDLEFDQPLQILGVFGVGPITARGHGSARTTHGVAQEND